MGTKKGTRIKETRKLAAAKETVIAKKAASPKKQSVQKIVSKTIGKKGKATIESKSLFKAKKAVKAPAAKIKTPKKVVAKTVKATVKK